MAWNTKDLTDSLMEFVPNRYNSKTHIVVREVELSGFNGRADVLAMQYTFSKSKAIVFEVKISRSDLLSDLRANKWRKYLNEGAVVFCFPEGMAEAHEIPKEAGILVRGETEWKIVRRPLMKGVPEISEYLHKRIIFAMDRDQRANRIKFANEYHQREREKEEAKTKANT